MDSPVMTVSGTIRKLTEPEYQSRLLKCLQCGSFKETSHMQLWYDDGFRNINCSRCKKMSRSTHWLCCHQIEWHKCLIHREDPLEHRTIRSINRVSAARPMVLLPSTRSGPAIKRMRVSKLTNAKRKSIIQSENPAPYAIDFSKCPRLALKFPHLYSAREQCVVEDASRVNQFSCVGVPETTTELPSQSARLPPVVVQPRRSFRYPTRGAVLDSSSHQSFLPQGVFEKEGGCADGSHNRADDQRSKLL